MSNNISDKIYKFINILNKYRIAYCYDPITLELFPVMFVTINNKTVMKGIIIHPMRSIKNNIYLSLISNV